MSAQKNILVTGATGKQGGATINALLAATTTSTHIFALTRDRSSTGAHKLAAKSANITVIEGDLVDCNGIFEKTGPIWGVFSVQTNNDAEEQQGKNLIDAAVSHNVQHFVYSSGDRGGPEKSELDATFVKNFRAKFMIEKYLQARVSRETSKGMAWTILRPVTFYENVTLDFHGRTFTRMWEQLGEKKLQMVATTDIGFFAAQALLRPGEWQSRALTIVGDELTQPEADALFRKVIEGGKAHGMPIAPCPLGSVAKWAMKGTVGDMFKWFEEVGYGGDVADCKRMNPNMQTFESWLRHGSPFTAA